MTPRRQSVNVLRVRLLFVGTNRIIRFPMYMILLMLLGLVVMYAIGPQRANVLNTVYGTDYYGSTYFFFKQTISLFLAVVAFAIAAALPYQILQKYATKLVIVGFAACALLVFLAIYSMLMQSLSVVWVRVGGYAGTTGKYSAG